MKMKRILCGLSAMTMLLTATSCGKKKDEPAKTSDGKTIINLWTFTDEVPGMIKKYVETHPDFAKKYEVKETIIGTSEGAYQPALDQALAGGGKDAPDIYCAEAAFILKYSQGEASKYAATYEDLGIDVDAKIKEADIAQYTVDIGSRDGKVVGLGYQATGGAFIYRRSIAKAVFGTDDAKTVEDKIGAGSGNWDKFFDAAAECKSKGYAMISGDGDLWHAVENSSDKGWIVDGKLTIDPKREAFLDLSKQLKDNGYHHDSKDWEESWFADMKADGGVLGFFGPAWLINYTIGQNCGGEKVGEGSYGDWAVCAPPVGFFWGGTWILANKDTKVKDGVKELIEWITLDSSETGLQYMWANGTLNGEGGTKDCVASGTVMKKSKGDLEFLGGQNMFDAFVPANAYANGKNLTQYDETINGYWRDQVRQYTSGEKSRDDAIKDFKQKVKDELDIDAA